MSKPTDTELMQQAYDALGRAFPLRHPTSEGCREVFYRSYDLVKEARKVLEEHYRPKEPGKEERRPSTAPERAACVKLGCSPNAWSEFCPLHGGPSEVEMEAARLLGSARALLGIVLEHGDLRGRQKEARGLVENPWPELVDAGAELDAAIEAAELAEKKSGLQAGLHEPEPEEVPPHSAWIRRAAVWIKAHPAHNPEQGEVKKRLLTDAEPWLEEPPFEDEPLEYGESAPGVGIM